MPDWIPNESMVIWIPCETVKSGKGGRNDARRYEKGIREKFDHFSLFQKSAPQS
jgi:hypothetical protein